ncbi:MAG: hypothetical protein KDA57_15890, partial [Planctomycetales bacterium]|nr:hypothetical protein [Planctomycetales bacterium]
CQACLVEFPTAKPCDSLDRSLRLLAFRFQFIPLCWGFGRYAGVPTFGTKLGCFDPQTLRLGL